MVVPCLLGWVVFDCILGLLLIVLGSGVFVCTCYMFLVIVSLRLFVCLWWLFAWFVGFAADRCRLSVFACLGFVFGLFGCFWLVVVVY